MNKQLPQTLKGFRDFLPEEKRKRDYVLKKIVEVFENFGFEPTQTPGIESASLLLGKYGEEADRLVFNFVDNGGRQVGLPYDQTVPTARVLAQYQNELPKFFRRYQIMNVFRAEKPQKGRYREFTQCDIDIFGSNSPLADAEILTCTYFAYKNVGYPSIILKINDRQTLFQTLEPFATEKVNVFSIIQSIDKLDKQTTKEVSTELVKKGLSESQAEAALEKIKNADMSDNLKQIVDSAKTLGVPAKSLEFSPNLARGLDYYTGMIFETSIPEYAVGSCGGGGRYDNLIEQIGGNSTPAVGIAFGFDRMVEAADQLNLIPTDNIGTQVLVTIFDENTRSKSLEIASKLRAEKISTELYPAQEKLAKQFKLANQKNIPWVIVIGEEEIKQNKVTLKNMESGEQELLSLENAVKSLDRLL